MPIFKSLNLLDHSLLIPANITKTIYDKLGTLIYVLHCAHPTSYGKLRQSDRELRNTFDASKNPRQSQDHIFSFFFLVQHFEISISLFIEFLI